MTDSIHWTGDLPSGGRMEWPCTCFVCGFDHIWVVMSERTIIREDGSFWFDGDKVDFKGYPYAGSEDPVREHGYPVFWKRGRDGDIPEDPPFFKPNWTKNVALAKHFMTYVEAEAAATEATLLHPTAIGKLRAIQFRIR